MNSTSKVTANSVKGLAYVELLEGRELNAYVTHGSLNCKDGFSYEEVEASELEKIDQSVAPLSYYKVKNRSVFMPWQNRIRFIYRKFVGRYKVLKRRLIDSEKIKRNMKTFVSHLITSCVSSVVAAYAALHVFIGDVENITQKEFIDFYLPIFVSILTLTGLYLTIKEGRDNYHRQRSDAVKPNLNFEYLSQDIDYTVCVEHMIPILDGNQEILLVKFKVQNNGLGSASNIGFYQANKGKITRLSTRIKALTPSNEVIVELRWCVELDEHVPMLFLYSRSEDVYGKPVIHMHLFSANSNGRPIYHHMDMFIGDEHNMYRKILDSDIV